MVRSIIPLFTCALLAAAPALATELVPVPHFDAVELSGGGVVSVAPGPAERVTIVEGSSRFTHIYVDRHNKLKIDTCNDQCPNHYRLRVEVQSPRVPVLAVTGGGLMSLSGGFGRVNQITAAVSGGGRIDTRPVDADTVTAAVNGGGELFVRARSVLTGAVNGGGNIRYWGDPQVTSAIDGGGTIRPGNGS